MKQDKIEPAARRLCQVPPGQVEIRLCQPGEPEGRLITVQTQTSTAGKGCREMYSLFPGAEASINLFLGPEASFRHKADPWVLEMDYCRSGRMGWDMHNGLSVYLGEGDLSVHGMDCCADSTIRFPLGYSEGVSVAVDLKRLTAEGPQLLRDAGIQGEKLQKKFCTGRPLAIPACPELEHLFAPLYTASPALRLPLLTLKVQELLLYLDGIGPDQKQLNQYGSRQTECIREIHRYLTGHLDQRITIQELSRRYLINPSTLKEVFKGVYGLPIAAYMKEYRVRQAMQLLRDTDASIAEIAARVGYESQGKFTQAFKDIARTLPTEYRRNCRAGGRE